MPYSVSTVCIYLTCIKVHDVTLSCKTLESTFNPVMQKIGIWIGPKTKPNHFCNLDADWLTMFNVNKLELHPLDRTDPRNHQRDCSEIGSTQRKVENNTGSVKTFKRTILLYFKLFMTTFLSRCISIFNISFHGDELKATIAVSEGSLRPTVHNKMSRISHNHQI